ncbi:hypothetical protein HK098_008321 [Nowakowskiella sp. JEL0407]|nr:hypothetical protein HK098_008321 [Nowakowskiella sp. JEL0407]
MTPLYNPCLHDARYRASKNYDGYSSIESIPFLTVAKDDDLHLLGQLSFKPYSHFYHKLTGKAGFLPNWNVYQVEENRNGVNLYSQFRLTETSPQFLAVVESYQTTKQNFDSLHTEPNIHNPNTHMSVITTWANPISISEDGKTVCIRNAQTGSITQISTGHIGVNAVAISNDNLRLVSASADNTLKIWDTNTGKLVKTLQGHTSRVIAVGISNDGCSIVSVGDDKTVKIWDASSGSVVRTLTGEIGVLSAVALNLDANQSPGSKPWQPISEKELRPMSDPPLKSSDQNALSVYTPSAASPPALPVAHTLPPVSSLIDSKPLVNSESNHTNPVYLNGNDVSKLSYGMDSGDKISHMQIDYTTPMVAERMVVAGIKDPKFEAIKFESGEEIKKISGPSDTPTSVWVSPDAKFNGPIRTNITSDKVWAAGKVEPHMKWWAENTSENPPPSNGHPRISKPYTPAGDPKGLRNSVTLWKGQQNHCSKPYSIGINNIMKPMLDYIKQNNIINVRFSPMLTNLANRKLDSYTTQEKSPWRIWSDASSADFAAEFKRLKAFCGSGIKNPMLFEMFLIFNEWQANNSDLRMLILNPKTDIQYANAPMDIPPPPQPHFLPHYMVKNPAQVQELSPSFSSPVPSNVNDSSDHDLTEQMDYAPSQPSSQSSSPPTSEFLKIAVSKS